MADGNDTVYYVISDLHIGGDEQLEQVDFHDELLQFLQRLEEEDEDVELIINGDAFGLWEFTEIEGLEKFDVLVELYPDLFKQFRETGESIQITLLPGNHDYELAAYDEYKERFKEYNIDLVQEESLTRDLGDRRLWFEHGHQRDPHNRIEDFGAPHATPLGYFMNTYVTSSAGKVSDRGRYNWLKDIQAVTPASRIPTWLISKYFYREMNPFLRYAAVPFLLLINISIFLSIFAGLDRAGLWDAPFNMVQAFMQNFGLAGEAASMLLTVNIVIAGLLLIIGSVAYVFLRDIKNTLNRFGLFDQPVSPDLDRLYEEAAQNVFTTHPDVAIFCYGHTHRPGIKERNDRLLVNTGTWLKRLHRRDVVAGRLPPVYYPSYQLTAVRIAESREDDPDGVEVTYEEIEKPSPTREDLSFLERLLTLGREPEPSLPDRQIVTEQGIQHPDRED
ncbi:MAG: metallophosphoesterase [Candidatus Nanohaloarchaea archaeon]|nr:metallophosphoesterase [Candidatus Nanohaloarchaea archaeon]